MKTLIRTLAASLAAAFTTGAMAVPVDFSGYLRSGAGTSTAGGKEVCFRLPGAIVWFRLGNECDTYAALTFGATLGQVDGTSFKAHFTTAYGTQQMANWEQTTPAFREAYVELVDIGAAMKMPALKGATLWAGKRFYKNPDVHMLDYTYWEPAQGPGFGLDGIDVGIGKLSYAMIRSGDFTGYGIDTKLGGYNPDLIGGGSRTATSHDLRLEGIDVNPGGKLTVGANLIRANNRGGTSTYTTQTTTQVVGVDGKVYDVVVNETHTIENTPGKNGFGLTISHKQDNLLGLGGFHNVVLQFARNAASLKGFGFAGSTDDRREWMLFDHWVIEPKGSPITASMTAGVRNARINGQSLREYWVGARPEYHINNIWSLMSEVGYQQVKAEGEAARKLAKVTLGTQFAMGPTTFSRPSIRFYTTYAKWNDAAAAAGSVACTGRDCNTAVPQLDDKRKGVSYGVQVEAWF